MQNRYPVVIAVPTSTGQTTGCHRPRKLHRKQITISLFAVALEMESRYFAPDEFLNRRFSNNNCFAKFWGKTFETAYRERRETVAVKDPAQLRLKSEER